MSEADHRPVSARSIGRKIEQITAAFGPVRHHELLKFLEEQDTPLTARRWEELTLGLGPDIDGQLVDALADFFTLPVAYLDGSDPVVEDRVEAQLDLLAAMREAQVRSMGTADPGGLTPDTMRSMAARLRQKPPDEDEE